jgi:hypothetical protein
MRYERRGVDNWSELGILHGQGVILPFYKYRLRVEVCQRASVAPMTVVANEQPDVAGRNRPALAKVD